MPAFDDPLVVATAAVVLTVAVTLLSGAKKIKQVPLPYGVWENNVLWNHLSVGKHKSSIDGALTAYDVMVNTCKKFPAALTAGKRPLVKRHWVDLNGKKVEKLELADSYDWITYQQFETTMTELGAGMTSLLSLKANDCIIIYAETAREWFLAAQGAFSQGLTVVTIYATLGEEAFMHGAAQTKAKLVVADAKLLKVVGNVFKSKNPLLKGLEKVVYIPDDPRTPDPVIAKQTAEAIAAIQSAGIEVLTFDELASKGRAAGLAPRPPKPDDLAIIMYTSGTTGMPKGVKISHSNVVATVAGLNDKLPTFPLDFVNGGGETYLAYLPLAHIMEIAAEIVCYSLGMQVGYGSPHTLTPTGVKIMSGTCKGDAQVLQPTLMVFAPAVLDKVYVGLNQKMKAASPIVQTLFKWGLAAGERRYDRGLVGSSWLYDKLVFSKVQALLGGRIKACVTGSAPLSPGIQKFVQTCFNAPVRQGYGLTETCASSCIGEACDNTTGIVGPPTTATSIKLRDWDEGGYRTADAADPAIGMPRGEILIGGPMVSQGYLVDAKDPDPEVVAKNATEFITEADGTRYFCTGDIGQVHVSGSLQIIDRKKDLVKLQQGEYVALSKVENVLKGCTLVEVPMVYAESTYDHCIALICPSHVALKELGKSLGCASDDVATLCDDETVITEITKQCLAACKGKLVGFEIPRKFGLIADTFTPENDMLTSAFKLKRKPASEKHKALINKLYGK